MSLIREIAQWADGQAEWMSDAVRRIVSQGALTDSDRADLVALMKTSAGLPDEKNRKGIRVALDALPQVATPGVDVCITALRHPKNLNAIDFDDGITFEQRGLTVVYGYNGSGKSGYARALKKACRARNTEPILPNVFSPPNPVQPAQARFEWIASGVAAAADWKDGSASPPALSRVAIFDSHCARVFVDEQADISYIPYGMDVLRELSSCMGKAQEALEKERASAKFDRSILGSLAAGETEVGRLVASIDRRMDPRKVEALAKLTAEDRGEVEELARLLSNHDAQTKAQALRRLAQRLDALQQELTRLASPLSDEHLQKLRTSLRQLKAAHQAAMLASQAVKSGTLAGTGTDPWATLLQSAADFAKLVYADHEFPGPVDANCVLCQQPLSVDAHQRLKKFWEFLQADAQRKYEQHRKESKALYVEVRDVQISHFPLDKAILEELAEVGGDVVTGVRGYVDSLAARQHAVKEMAANEQLDELAALPARPQEAMQALKTKLLEQASGLEQGMTPEQRQAKQKRLAELQARLKLADSLPVVLQAIEADKRDFLFAEALKCCQTRALTQKSGELYEKTVTQDLQQALARELKALGVDVNVALDTSGQKGVRMQQLRLKAAAIPKAKLSGILSEGEQRAIAIASFLAEVSLEPGKSGIVFDDPVNSLDHRRRERIAKRLAQEAQTRQVIVFTHDLAFAWELQQAAEALGHKAAVRHVYAAGASKGRCSDKLPFEGQKVKTRINVLKDQHFKAKKSLEQDKDYEQYNELVRSGYRMLRDTWELLVEDHIFNGTVKRFQRPISTLRLRSVMVEDEHAKAVFDGMTRASNFTHEGGAEAPPTLPEPADFLADVLALENAFNSVIESNNATAARREKLGVPS